MCQKIREMKKLFVIIYLLFIGFFSYNAAQEILPSITDSLKKDSIILETFITTKNISKYPFLKKTDSIIRVLKKDPILRNAHWGFCLYNPASKEILIDKESYASFLPASTTKLLSSEAALHYLGENYRWKTQVLYTGTIDSLGVLQGDIYVVYNGDPTIGLDNIRAKSHYQLATEVYSALQSNNIKSINGNIIAETVVFKKDEKFYTISKNYINFGDYYSVIPSKENLTTIKDIEGNMNAQTEEDLASMQEEKDPEEQILDQIVADLENSIRMFKLGSFEYKNTMLPSPPAFLSNKIREFLVKKGLKINGKVITQDYKNLQISERRKLLISYDSPPLADLVYFTNQKSSNPYAEHMLRTVGYFVGKQDSKYTSIKTIEKHLKEIDFEFYGFKLDDGSGLSRGNWIAPISQVKFLSYVMTQPYYQTYYYSLPSAGETGTLARMFTTSPLKGNIHAKTGTLSGVKTLAGYIDLSNGERLTFSLLINSFNGSVDSVKNRMEKLLNTLVY